MNKNIVKYGLIAVGVIVIIMSLRATAKWKGKYNDSQAAVVNILEKDSLEIIDKDRQIAEAKTIVLGRDKKIEGLLDSLNTLKDVEAVTRVIYRTRVDTVKIGFENPVQDVIEIDHGDSLLLPPGDYLRLPQSFSVNEQWYSISGGVNKSGFSIDEFSFKNDLSISLGTKKKGLKFWKRDEPVVQVRDLNPYSVINSIESFKLEDSRKPRNFSFGIQMGYGVIGTETGYYVGLGVSYSLFKF